MEINKNNKVDNFDKVVNSDKTDKVDKTDKADKVDNFQPELVKQALAAELEIMLTEENNMLGHTSAKPGSNINTTFNISDSARGPLLDFLVLMLEQNITMNLSGITEPRDVIRLHLLDSLTVLPFLDAELTKTAGGDNSEEKKSSLKVLDLGTGAGFPGVPLKIVRPEVSLYLVDALAKRINFLRRSLTTLEVPQPWTALHARAEEIGRNKKHREQYDFVCARAVAKLNTLLEYTLPLVRVGGVFCAMKAKAQEEINEAKNATKILGGEIERIEQFTLAGTGQERTIITFRKIQPCAKKYPRANAKIKKTPL